jgi:hypothetical protein
LHVVGEKGPTREFARMTVIDLKQAKPKQAPRDLVEIDKSSAAARFFDKMQRDIIADCGGRRRLSRIELELVEAFCGAATTLRYLNHQVMLGELSEIDLGGYATIASTMLRIGSKLGLGRRARDVTPSLGSILRQGIEQQRERTP